MSERRILDELENLKKEVRELRDEVRRKTISEPYPVPAVYVVPCYYPRPWWDYQPNPIFTTTCADDVRSFDAGTTNGCLNG